MPASRATEFLRGWRVVAGAFLVTMVGYGAIYSYAAFAQDLAESFGASRASASMVFALSGACCFAVGGLTGPLADRFGPRALATAGMAIVATGLLTAAAATSMTQVVLSYGVLIGLGTGCAYVPAVAAVQRWFVARRGLASGIAASGVGVGTALVPPMAEFLATYGDWRVAFAISGLAAAVVGLTGALLLSPAPEAHGLHPDGAPAAMPQSGAAAKAVLASRDFALFYVGTLLVSMPVALPFGYLVATARDIGVSGPAALGLLGTIGIGSVAGRFLLGAIADLAGRRLVFLASSAGIAGATALWAAASGIGTLSAFAFLFGMFHGGFVALLPAFAADQFGRRSAGSVIGVLYTGRAIALLAAPLALAHAMDALDDHRLPVAGAAVIGLLGVLLLARVARPPGG